MITKRILDLKPYLYVNGDNVKDRYIYVAGELVKLLGFDEVEVLSGKENKLIIGDRVISESKLNYFFDVITLNRESNLKKDIHSRIDNNGITWKYDEAELNNFIEEIFPASIREVKKNNFKVIFSHDIDWTTLKVPISIVKSFLTSIKAQSGWIPLTKVFGTNELLKTYSKLLSIEKKYNVKTWNFMLSGPSGSGRFSSRYDIKWETSKRYADIILTSDNYLGLHGSYFAADQDSYLVEKQRIEDYTGSEIISHRNHYLRFNPHKIASQLEKAGFNYDFSVGYSDLIGFRSGVANKYKLYNFQEERKSSVTEIPLLFMERDSHLENQDNTLDVVKKSLEIVKVNNGCVSILFHPSSFLINSEWFSFYEKIMKLCCDLGADVSGKITD